MSNENETEAAASEPQGKNGKDPLGFIFQDLDIPDQSVAAEALKELREQKIRERNGRMMDFLERISRAAETEKTSIRTARRAFDAHLNGRRKRMEDLKALAQKVVDCDPATYENFYDELAKIQTSVVNNDFRTLVKA